MIKQTSQTRTADEVEIHGLIDRWSAAVRAHDYSAIRANHDADMLMFDVPPPFQSRGIDAYMATWDLFFKCADRPATFNFTDVNVTAGDDVAFATAVGHCTTVNDGRRESLEFRLTMGLRKIDGRWTIVHEHHSVPSE
ncbi:MAG TPA: nuclear transport factor 2 family protein [Candidatus Binatia bacterium]|nr:nuclear transport factor 2 family protein [Candidatus Binatia bacterium]